MAAPEGSLTPAQFEILELLWSSDEGLSVAEIWEAVCAERDVGRTTVLNLVDRLEKRGWLRRHRDGGIFRYRAVLDRAQTEARLASAFIGDFFDGSPAGLLTSLLGSQRIDSSELARIKALLDDTDMNERGEA